MKTLLILIAFCFSIITYGQNEVLVLTKTKNGKERIIEQNKKIKVLTIYGNVYKGRFQINGDSIVIPEEASIALDEISMINRIPLGLRIAGGGIAGLGGLATVGLGIIIVELLAEGSLFAVIMAIFVVPPAAAAILVTATGVILIVSGKKYKKIKWNYEIRNIEP